MNRLINESKPYFYVNNLFNLDEALVEINKKLNEYNI